MQTSKFFILFLILTAKAQAADGIFTKKDFQSLEDKLSAIEEKLRERRIDTKKVLDSNEKVIKIYSTIKKDVENFENKITHSSGRYYENLTSYKTAKKNYLESLDVVPKSNVSYGLNQFKFSEEEYQKIFKVNAAAAGNVDTDIKFSYKTIKLIYDNWKWKERTANFYFKSLEITRPQEYSSGRSFRTLFKIIEKSGYLKKFKIVEILKRDPSSLRDILDEIEYKDKEKEFIPVLKNMFLDMLKKGEKVSNYSNPGRFFEYLYPFDPSLLAKVVKNNPSFGFNSYSDNSPHIKVSLFARLGVKEEELKNIHKNLFGNICHLFKVYEPSLLKFSTKELADCIDSLKGYEIARLFEYYDIKLSKELFDIILNKHPKIVSSLAQSPYLGLSDLSFFKPFLEKEKSVLLLKLNATPIWKQYKNHDNRYGSNLTYKCSSHIPFILREDKELLIKAIKSCPSYDFWKHDKYINDQEILEAYFKVWIEFKMAMIDLSNDSKYSEEEKYYSSYYSIFNNNRYQSNHKAIVPFDGAPYEIFQNTVFIKKFLEYFPIVYFKIPLDLRSNFSEFKTKAESIPPPEFFKKDNTRGRR